MSNKRPTIYKLLFISSCFLIISSAASAQTNNPDYKLLAPIPINNLNETSESVDADASTYIPAIFRLTIALAGVLAVLMIMYGGIKYLTSDSFGGKSDARATIENALWGLLLAMSAWLIVYTVNPDLVKLNLELPQVYIGSTVLSTSTPLYTGGGLAGSAGGLSGAEVKRQLEEAEISIVPGILLHGVRQEVIDEVIRLKSNCSGCDILVNSATGGVHNPGVCSHANGWKIDLNDTASLNSFITDNYRRTGTRGDGAVLYTAPSGAIYAREDDHWDIQIPCR